MRPKLGHLALAVLFWGCDATPLGNAVPNFQEDAGGRGGSNPPDAAGGADAFLPDLSAPLADAGGSPDVPAGDGGSTEPITITGNPFEGAVFYVNPDWADAVRAGAALVPEAERAKYESVAAYSTAVWLDRIAAVSSVSRHLDNALAEQERLGRPVVTLFVVYDLPNRDCAARASAGELLLADDGLNRYKTEFIDAIAEQFRAHPNQRIVAILEPDSLPNLATNLSVPRCQESVDGYKDGVAYAVKTLSAPHVALYLDAAHSGWLGWPNNRAATAEIFKEVLEKAGGAQLIRGFASNSANYTVLDEVAEQFDYQFNPCHDEHSYVREMAAALAAAGVTRNNFLIDTSRNGVGGIRRQWGYWCNVRGAGIGERPRADPRPGVDAYVWVKPPGESDGVSDPTATRYDSSCTEENALVPAPEAGQWFQAHFEGLVQNADPPL